MTSLNEIIDRSESELERLALQRQQEEALHELMPIRFSANMAAFKRYLPNIYQQFSNYKPQSQFTIYCTENGIANLRWLDNNVSLYGQDPYSECLQQVEAALTSGELIKFHHEVQWDPFQQQHFLYLNSILNDVQTKSVNEKMVGLPHDIPLMLMFGLGLGYQLGYIYERKNVANIFIFETNIDLFYASIYCFEWAPLLDYIADNKLGLHIFLGQDDNYIMQDLKAVVDKKGPFLCSQVFGMSHYQSAPLLRLQEQVAKQFYSLAMGWGFFDDSLFGLANSVTHMVSGEPFIRRDKRLPAVIRDIPVFVIANGPSLDHDIEFIKANKSHAILVACGTAINSLYRAGVTPDIYVAVERVDLVAYHLSQINDDEYLREILMIAPDVIHPDTRNKFKRAILGIKSDEPIYSLLCNNFAWVKQLQSLSCINPLVGNFGISLPLHLGFSQIYLFGLDNGFKCDEHHHSRLSSYYDDDGKPIEAYKAMTLAQADNIRPGNFGGEVKSNQLFSASVLMAEFIVSHCPDVAIYNCSDGALIKGAEPVKSDTISLPDTEVDKQVVVDYLYNEMSMPLTVSRDEISTLMDTELFDRVITLIQSDWREPFISRSQTIETMQRNMEYLNVIRESKQTHIYNILFGTINSFFTLYTMIAYEPQSEQEGIARVNEHKYYFLSLLDRMKEIYPQALDYVQGRHIAAVPGLSYQVVQ